MYNSHYLYRTKSHFSAGMKLRTSVIIILLLLLLTVSATAELEDINVNANGYNWNSMSMSEKALLTTLLYKKLGTDEQKYPLKDVVKKMDDYYSLARHKPANEQNGYLIAPVACIMGQITGCKIERLDDYEEVKKAIHEPEN